jgi:hypothetical protein
VNAKEKPMNPRCIRTVAVAAVLAGPPALVLAQGIRQERVSFKAGSSSATLTGSLKGDETVDYVLNARAGQSMRVALMQRAARRNETADYTLSVGITAAADAKVAGTPYHATGVVPCSVGPDPKGSAKCSFGVIRGARGQAQVYLASPGFDVTLHKDQLRILRFLGDKVTSSDAKEKVTASRQGDDWQISVNDFYFYTIPDAFIVGG